MFPILNIIDHNASTSQELATTLFCAASPCPSHLCFHFKLSLLHWKPRNGVKTQMKCTIIIVSEYDQEIPQSQTADNPVAPRGRAAQPSRDTRKTNCFSSGPTLIVKIRATYSAEIHHTSENLSMTPKMRNGQSHIHIVSLCMGKMLLNLNTLPGHNDLAGTNHVMRPVIRLCVATGILVQSEKENKH